jgi:dethiobiotin synthetase
MPSARSYFVTGTDTDVGKTCVTAGLARWLAASGAAPTIVKPVQTGVAPGEAGDAARAARLAGCAFLEFERYAAAADPGSAALAEGRPPPLAAGLARRIAAVPGAVVVEGAGGIAVPLNGGETFADLGRLLQLPAIVVVGLRLGCISHALLSAAFLRAHGVAIAGAFLVERFGPVGDGYIADVTRALAAHLPSLGVVPYAGADGDVATAEYVATLAAKGLA